MTRTRGCGCGPYYACGRCGECYACRHAVVEGEWPGIRLGWRCPDGRVNPAYPDHPDRFE